MCMHALEVFISNKIYEKDSYFSNLQLVLCKRLTLSASSIFVTEGLFIYIYFQLFEENHQNGISISVEKSSTISLFFCKIIP